MNPITIASGTPPVVEIDTEARAAYIRFSHAKVERTIPIDSELTLVAMDLDERGSVVGIEVVGATEFSIAELLKLAPVTPLTDNMLSKARYVAAPGLGV